MKKNGFTLIELLSVIAILSLVVGLVIYTVLSVINSSIEKSYLITINNVEKKASNYLIENNNRLFYITDNSRENIEYQCVMVRSLVDSGFFDNDIIDSKINKNRNVSLDDYIYIERYIDSKSIVRTKYVINEDVSLCENAIKAIADISIDVQPDGFTSYKDIIIKYRLRNYDNINNYSYKYSYDKDNVLSVISDDGAVKKLRVTDNGTIRAFIADNNDSVIFEKSKDVVGIDNVGPIITIESNATSGYVKTIKSKIIVTDEGVGGDTTTYKYIYSKDLNTISNIEFTSGNTYELSKETGIYYLIAEACDLLGNCTKTVSDKLYIDNIPPVITVENDLVKVYGSKFDLFDGVTITDNTGVISEKEVYLGNTKITSSTELLLGENVVTYKALDGALNEASKTRKITLIVPGKEFNYKEENQYYNVEYNGTYIIEAYGAQGGNNGGKGGYVKAEVDLTVGDNLVINTGGVNGYNGGGGYKNSKYYSGGGASTVKYNEKYIVIAAGGGATGSSGSGTDGGNDTGKGGVNVGKGVGVDGSNGGGGSNSLNYNYNCNCKTCGGGCSSYAPTYDCCLDTYVRHDAVCRNWGICGGDCTSYAPTYSCNCQICTKNGESGKGGKNNVIFPGKEIESKFGFRTGNGYIKITYKVDE